MKVFKIEINNVEYKIIKDNDNKFILPKELEDILDGSALKPAHEPICLARKPLSEKTIVDNVLKWGTGGINIDKSRIGTEGGTNTICNDTKREKLDNIIQPLSNGLRKNEYKIENIEGLGRWPANFIHNSSDEVIDCFPESKSQKRSSKYNKDNPEELLYTPKKAIYTDDNSYDDSGSAARYFKSIIYQSKASKKEKNEGLDDFEEKRITMFADDEGNKQLGRATLPGNEHHPKQVKTSKNSHTTVKPVALMEYLINMITPIQGIVLDPFTGSGSTGVAAVKNNFSFIGIEMEEDYIKIAEARINYHVK